MSQIRHDYAMHRLKCSYLTKNIYIALGKCTTGSEEALAEDEIAQAVQVSLVAYAVNLRWMKLTRACKSLEVVMFNSKWVFSI